MDSKAKEREDFLLKFYHHLVKCIQPSQFFSWLRSKSVLSRDEKEEIENRYQVTSLRAGHLIDIILTKGEIGYVAFMECVEYIYPELYQDITGQKARPPPSDFVVVPNGRSLRRHPTVDRTKSTVMMNLMADLTQKLTQDLMDKKTKLSELQKLIKEVEEERDNEENEKTSLFVELDIVREQNDDLKLEIGKLKEKLQGLESERDACQAQLKEMHTKKDEAIEQCNQLREKTEKMGYKVEELSGEVRRERSMSCRHDHYVERLKKENQELKRQWDTHRTQCQAAAVPCTRGSESLLAEINDVKSKISELERKSETLTLENSELTDKCQRLEEMCALLKENNSERQQSISQFTAERDQYRKMYEEMKSKLSDSQKQNEDLSQQCRLYHDRCCSMSNKMRDMDKEIDMLREQSPNFRRPLSSAASSDEPRGSSSSFAQCFSPSTLAVSYPLSPVLRPNAGLARDQRVPVEKRKASYQTLKFFQPVVIFPPKEIERVLIGCLKKHFEICSYESCSVDSPESASITETNQEIVVYKHVSNSTIHFIKREQIQLRDKNVVLTGVPIHSVRRMKEVLQLSPIIIILKFKGRNSLCEYRQEEEVLNRTNPIKFDVITVDADFKKNFTQEMAESVVSELKKIVEKENDFQNPGLAEQ